MDRVHRARVQPGVSEVLQLSKEEEVWAAYTGQVDEVPGPFSATGATVAPYVLGQQAGQRSSNECFISFPSHSQVMLCEITCVLYSMWTVTI